MGMTTTITVIIPVCNAAPALAANLVEMADHFSLYAADYEFDYLILADRRARETHQTASAFARYRRNVTISTRERHRGFACTLRTALESARGEFAIVLDGALSYHPSVGMELVEVLEREQADIALPSTRARGLHRAAFAKELRSREKSAQKLWSAFRFAFTRDPALCFACRLQ